MNTFHTLLPKEDIEYRIKVTITHITPCFCKGSHPRKCALSKH